MIDYAFRLSAILLLVLPSCISSTERYDGDEIRRIERIINRGKSEILIVDSDFDEIDDLFIHLHNNGIVAITKCDGWVSGCPNLCPIENVDKITYGNLLKELFILDKKEDIKLIYQCLKQCSSIAVFTDTTTYFNDHGAVIGVKKSISTWGKTHSCSMGLRIHSGDEVVTEISGHEDSKIFELPLEPHGYLKNPTLNILIRRYILKAKQ